MVHSMDKSVEVGILIVNNDFKFYFDFFNSAALIRLIELF